RSRRSRESWSDTQVPSPESSNGVAAPTTAAFAVSERKRSRTDGANVRGEKAISLTKTGSSSKDSSRPTSAQSRSAALYGATECFTLATKPSTSISGETSDAEELSTDTCAKGRSTGSDTAPTKNAAKWPENDIFPSV